MKRIILSIFVLAGVSTYANAQLGLSSSYQLSHHKSEITGNTAVMNGYCGGIYYDMWLMPGLAFEPGIMYSFGTNVRTCYNSMGTPYIRNANEAVTERFLNVPLQARLQIPMGMATSVSFYFGPTVSLALTVPDGYSRSSMMLGGGAGLDLGPVTLKANYDLGAGYRGAFCIGLTFSFGSGFGYGTPVPRSSRGGYRPAPGPGPVHGPGYGIPRMI